MTVKEFLDSFGKDDMLALNPARTAGMSHNEEEAWNELMSLTDKIPSLMPVIKAACIANQVGDMVSEVACRVAVNMLVLMYKKDSQEHIDKLLASTKQD